MYPFSTSYPTDFSVWSSPLAATVSMESQTRTTVGEANAFSVSDTDLAGVGTMRDVLAASRLLPFRRWFRLRFPPSAFLVRFRDRWDGAEGYLGSGRCFPGRCCPPWRSLDVAWSALDPLRGWLCSPRLLGPRRCLRAFRPPGRRRRYHPVLLRLESVFWFAILQRVSPRSENKMCVNGFYGLMNDLKRLSLIVFYHSSRPRCWVVPVCGFSFVASCSCSCCVCYRPVYGVGQCCA